MLVRTAESPLADPLAFCRGAWREAWRWRGLAVQIGRREAVAQYRQSLLGPLLVLLPSLTLFGVGVAFQRALILDPGAASGRYELFLLIGVMLWTTFVDALHAPVQGLHSEQHLMARTGAPPEAIVVGMLGPVLLSVVLKVMVLALGLLAWSAGPVPAGALALLPALISLVVLGTGFGLLLAPINLVFRDVAKLLGTATLLWLLATPVYYQTPPEGALALLVRLNPVAHVISCARELALEGSCRDPAGLLAVSLGSIALLGLAWAWSRISLPVVMGLAND